jgi:hypothetical protein
MQFLNIEGGLEMRVSGIILAAVLVANVLIGSVDSIDYACEAGLSEIYPVTCYYNPAPGDIGGAVTVIIDSVIFPATIVYSSVSKAKYMFEFYQIAEGILQSQPHITLVGDLNDDGRVALDEIVLLIRRWKGEVYPPADLDTVVKAINNWERTGNAQSTASPSKTAQKKKIASMMQ